ncbi:MAG: CRISPR-associated endonuclease Cas1 [Firmicutes bacterium]|nr:CRISPR-associated endonuclease Cas1 [Bacillota bacterium]
MIIFMLVISNRVALVYDLMEPLRPKVEQLVLQFLQKCVFSPKDFLLLENGACRLHPQLAKIVSQITVAEETVNQVIFNAVIKLETL